MLFPFLYDGAVSGRASMHAHYAAFMHLAPRALVLHRRGAEARRKRGGKLMNRFDAGCCRARHMDAWSGDDSAAPIYINCPALAFLCVSSAPLRLCGSGLGGSGLAG